MTKDKLRIFVTRKLPPPVEQRLSELFDTQLRTEDTPLTQRELGEAVASADVLVPTLSDRIDQGVLAHAGPELRLIANFGAGVDHIDVETARRRGIVVSNTPGVLADDTADMTMALICAAPRRMVPGMDLLRRGEWTGWVPTQNLGRRLSGAALGIVGMGRIGQAVARRAAAFGLRIHYHNRRRLRAETEEALGARYWESLDQMLARMDIVSVHCPSTPATFHLLSPRRLKLMKRTACLINTARGEIVDENALARMLERGELAGAALDVFEHEPEVNPRLLALENVLMLPHMASATEEARLEMGEKVIINIKTFADGHRPPDRVVPAML